MTTEELRSTVSRLRELAGSAHVPTPDDVKTVWMRLKVAACQVLLCAGPEELTLLREAYEQACMIHIRRQDLQGFEKCFLLLEPLYMRFAQEQGEDAGSHVPKLLIYSVRLIRLLAAHRVGDFHILLERLTSQDRLHPAVRFATDLEKTLMSGNYQKAVEFIANPTDPLLTIPSKDLVESLRQRVAECLERSHKSISTSRAQQLLMLPTRDALRQFVETMNFKNLQEVDMAEAPVHNTIKTGRAGGPAAGAAIQWKMDGDSIAFVTAEESLASIPAAEVINCVLGYAGELERIV